MGFQDDTFWKHAHSTLTAVIDDIQKEFERRVEREIDEIKTEQAILKSLEEKSASLHSSLSAIFSRLDHIDTKVEEAIPASAIEGDLKFEHQHRLMSLAPKFVVNLESRFPIRNHKTDLGPGSSWNKGGPRCVKGEYSFAGLIKNSPFKDAKATITLYGWRKEIYAKEIQELIKSIPEIHDIQEANSEKEKTSKTKIQAHETKKVNQLAAIATCERDRLKLSARPQDLWSTPRFRKSMEIHSISAIALCLELDSLWFNDDSPFLDKSHSIWLEASSFMSIIGDNIKAYKAALKSCERESENMHTDALDSIHNAKRLIDIERVFDTEHEERLIQEVEKMTAVDETALNDSKATVMADLRTLNSSIRKLSEAAIDQLQICSDEINSRNDEMASEQEGQKHAITEWQSRAQADFEALNSAKILVAERPYGIGIGATMRQAKSAIEGFYSVFEGQRALHGTDILEQA